MGVIHRCTACVVRLASEIAGVAVGIRLYAVTGGTFFGMAAGAAQACVGLFMGEEMTGDIRSVACCYEP